MIDNTKNTYDEWLDANAEMQAAAKKLPTTELESIVKILKEARKELLDAREVVGAADELITAGKRHKATREAVEKLNQANMRYWRKWGEKS